MLLRTRSSGMFACVRLPVCEHCVHARVRVRVLRVLVYCVCACVACVRVSACAWSVRARVRVSACASALVHAWFAPVRPGRTEGLEHFQPARAPPLDSRRCDLCLRSRGSTRPLSAKSRKGGSRLNAWDTDQVSGPRPNNYAKVSMHLEGAGSLVTSEANGQPEDRFRPCNGSPSHPSRTQAAQPVPKSVC
eukprot:6213471-Pleurochrysis_carterae.AAC.3